MFALLYYQYWLHNILRRLNLHLKRGHDFDPKISVSGVYSEFVFCGAGGFLLSDALRCQLFPTISRHLRGYSLKTWIGCL